MGAAKVQCITKTRRSHIGGSTMKLMLLQHQGPHPRRSQWRIYYEAK